MNEVLTRRWESIRTKESQLVEEVLRKVFPNVDAYRSHSASIRVRVIDSRFEGKSIEDPDLMVEPILKGLPEAIQSDIMTLLTIAPSETTGLTRYAFVNLEFENPSPFQL